MMRTEWDTSQSSYSNSVVESSSSLQSSSSSSIMNVVEGLCCCPICMDPWTPQGPHQVCCLPCGHVYGMSCITKWIEQSSTSKNSKCPQCNLPCRLKDVRKLYASPLYLPDQHEQQLLHNLARKEPQVEYSAAAVDTTTTTTTTTTTACKLPSMTTERNPATPTYYVRRRPVTGKIDAGLLTSMHLFMGVLSLLICLTVYISLRHSIWMFLVTILMFLVAVMMFLVDEFLI